MSIKKFIQRLEPLRTAIIQIGDNEYTADPEIDLEIAEIVELLK